MHAADVPMRIAGKRPANILSDLEQNDAKKRTKELHQACKNVASKEVATLLDASTDVNEEDDHGLTPMDYLNESFHTFYYDFAVIDEPTLFSNVEESDFISIATMLIEAGALSTPHEMLRLNLVIHYRQALNSLVPMTDKKISNVLSQGLIDVNDLYHGETLLHRFVVRNTESAVLIIKKLLLLGANPNILNNDGDSVLDLLCKTECSLNKAIIKCVSLSEKIAELLIKHNANVIKSTNNKILKEILSGKFKILSTQTESLLAMTPSLEDENVVKILEEIKHNGDLYAFFPYKWLRFYKKIIWLFKGNEIIENAYFQYFTKITVAKEQAFNFAMEIDNLAAAKLLVKEGFDVNENNVCRNFISTRSLLHRAIMEKRYDWLEFLLTNGARLNLLDENGETPLFFACCNKDKQAVDIILKCRPDREYLHIPNKDGRIAFEAISSTSILDKVYANGCMIHNESISHRFKRNNQFIVQRKFSIRFLRSLKRAGFNFKSENFTNLFLIISSGKNVVSEKVLNFCLEELDLSLNEANKYHFTPLMQACKYNNTPLAEWLINAGANLDVLTEYRYDNSLRHATSLSKTNNEPKFDIITLLITSGIAVSNNDQLYGRNDYVKAIRGVEKIIEDMESCVEKNDLNGLKSIFELLPQRYRAFGETNFSVDKFQKLRVYFAKSKTKKGKSLVEIAIENDCVSIIEFLEGHCALKKKGSSTKRAR